ncbi:aspartyl aminopeptidase [Xylariaceae sp. AK1471]|nr:aspartyl aminopeptidase [Xylariaceae sp. AK1471]
MPTGNTSLLGVALLLSPCLRVKPCSKRQSEGFLRVSVEPYGKGLWQTRFDCDLGRCGTRDVLCIPTVARHLKLQQCFEFNMESLILLIASLVAAELNSTGLLNDESKVANEAGVSTNDKSVVGGLMNEFIVSSRLDNLIMSFCSVETLAQSIRDSPLSHNSTVNLITLFDHEQVGSQSAQGARSNFLPSVISRLSTTAYERTLARSFIIPADMAHSVHPNYPECHDAGYRRKMNSGPVIKVNANARYTTDIAGIILLREISRRAASVVPLQFFVSHNDVECGSTIRPILSTILGVRAVDLGNSLLNMHSIREVGGVRDVEIFCSLWSAIGRG